MSALVQILGAYAPGHVLSHAGKDYEFRRISQQTKAALTVLYFKRAREVVYLLRDEVPAAEYDRQLKAVLEDYRKGAFAFPGVDAMRYFLGEGLPEFVRALTGCTDAEARSLLEARGVETLHVCWCVFFDSMGSMSEEVKKNLASLEHLPEIQALVRLLSRTKNSNGSPSSSSTGPPASPDQTSPLESSPS